MPGGRNGPVGHDARNVAKISQTQSVKHGVRRGAALLFRTVDLAHGRAVQPHTDLGGSPDFPVPAASATRAGSPARGAARRTGMRRRSRIPRHRGESLAGPALQAFTPDEYAGQERNWTRWGRNARSRTGQCGVHRFAPASVTALYLNLAGAPLGAYRGTPRRTLRLPPRREPRNLLRPTPTPAPNHGTSPPED